MKRKVRIFIYALVAWFVGLAVITYDFAVSYAASFNEDIIDAEWHYFNANGEDSVDKLELFDYDEVGTDIKIPTDSKINDCKYVEKFTRASKDGNYDPAIYDYVIGSNSEVVLVYENYGAASSNGFFYSASSSYTEGTYSYLISKDTFYYYGGSVKEKGSGYNYDFYTYESTLWSGLYLTVAEHGAYKYHVNYKAINSHKMKVFFSVADAKKYLNDGDLSGLAWQGKSKEYDGDSIYLNDFQMIVHDSNAYSAYYLEFKYTIPEQLRDAASLQLDIAEEFNWTMSSIADSVRYPVLISGTDVIDLLQYPSGFKLYLDDIEAIHSFVGDKKIDSSISKRQVLGSEAVLDLDMLSIMGFGGVTFAHITDSKLFLTCHVVANDKYGVSYNGDVNFLSGSNNMSSYTPDASGNYKYNDDFKNQGHYYTNVSTDAAGNTTYNYYYYGTDNSRTEITAKDSTDGTVTVVPGPSGSIINNITMPDHIFVSVSGSTGSSGGSSGSGSDVGNVTIEDDDLSFNSLRDSIKDGYGLIDDTDTGTKGDGLIAMLSDLFGYLPAKFVGLIMLGTSSVVGIAVLRMIFKR